MRLDQPEGLVEHSLVNDWNWLRVMRFTEQITNINKTHFRDLGNGGYTLGGLHQLIDYKSFLDELQLLLPEYYPRAGMYVSSRADSKTFPLHTDPGQYLWVWQIIGETPWEVGNQSFILKENDMLFINPGTPHRAIPNSPRASITFSLEKN